MFYCGHFRLEDELKSLENEKESYRKALHDRDREIENLRLENSKLNS